MGMDDYTKWVVIHIGGLMKVWVARGRRAI